MPESRADAPIPARVRSRSDSASSSDSHRSLTADVTKPLLSVASAVAAVPIAAATLLWHEAEVWQRDNHYIHSGYRRATNSFRRSAWTVGQIHNETVNIWSHLLGAVIGLAVATTLYLTLGRPAGSGAVTGADVVVFGAYFGGLVTCLALSASYHTLSNHSQAIQKMWNRFDYLGIVILTWGSFVSCLYYGFWDHPQLIIRYWLMITTISVGGGTVCLSQKFASGRWRPFRAAMFICIGLSGVVPILHGLRIYDLADLNARIGLSWIVTEGALYITGAVIYAARFPERLKPGAFDIVGSSHQIFHVFVLCAAAAHFVALVTAFEYHHRPGATPPPSLDFGKWLRM